jgi:FixJ family two-component response regulator
MTIYAADQSSIAAPAPLSAWSEADQDVSGEPAVHVIDDDDSFRTGMLRILRVCGHRAIGYGCAGEFLLRLQGEASGCCLLDITMPGPSGMDLLRALKQRGSAPPIIFVTARDDVMTSDYIVKPASAARVLAVVERALQVDAKRVAARTELRELSTRFATLTGAERTIFAGVISHRLNKQMAADLSACERTVKALRARMMSKLRARTVPELVRAAAVLEQAGISVQQPSGARQPAYLA